MKEKGYICVSILIAAIRQYAAEYSFPPVTDRNINEPLR